MNVKMFNNDVDFFIFTTNKKYAAQLKEFCTTTKSKDYWQKVQSKIKAIASKEQIIVVFLLHM